ncbi:hypothetical protein O8C79_12540, partial [Aliarcobacter butzleri]|uniref:hypothetical protein n=1 Tax=Aliarcobacter butzleri TaxID=28197 RepID=UPI00263F536C
IKTQFNKPLKDVINIMENYLFKVNSQISEIETFIKTNNSSEKYQVEKKLVNLQAIQKNISLYLNKLELSLQ